MPARKQSPCFTIESLDWNSSTADNGRAIVHRLAIRRTSMAKDTYEPIDKD
ncbi:MAG: hypothetical protein FWC25_03350 [Dehalococcoidia bacterium]|nr:hypothetical protein [Dehalococcoidia bacterium]